jgi:hypothetical protein
MAELDTNLDTEGESWVEKNKEHSEHLVSGEKKRLGFILGLEKKNCC